MINEHLKVKGELTITLKSQDGVVKKSIHVPNLVVAAGKDYIASRITSNTATVMSHMAIGDSSSSPQSTDTSLQSELGRSEFLSFAANNNTVTASANFEAGVATGSITEAGIFNSSTSGTMLCRTTFPVVNKEAGDSITISWLITVS